MFEIKHYEDLNAEGKTIYIVSLSAAKKLKFTNKLKMFEYFKDLDIFFQDYYFMLEVFYHRLKMFDRVIADQNLFDVRNSRNFHAVEEMRINIFLKKQDKKSACDIAHYINQFNSAMMHLCFFCSKQNVQEAEKIYHLLTDLQSKFYTVFFDSYEHHLNKSLKLFI